jgi:hypothetical protein
MIDTDEMIQGALSQTKGYALINFPDANTSIQDMANKIVEIANTLNDISLRAGVIAETFRCTFGVHDVVNLKDRALALIQAVSDQNPVFLRVCFYHRVLVLQRNKLYTQALSEIQDFQAQYGTSIMTLASFINIAVDDGYTKHATEIAQALDGIQAARNAQVSGMQ